MRASLAITIVIYAFGLALWSAAQAVLRGSDPANGRGRASEIGRAAMWVLQAGLVIQAVLEGVSLAAGRRPADMATHLSYLAASVILLPLFMAVRRDRQTSTGFLESIACAAAAVVALRLQATSGVPHA
ncbi:hypothetical protein [Streptomyces sp. NPDC001292]|uniref:hypothetical protein n=1 Tax=Streptomyces sp. NPDC001292 TaxID=3364558 RepID=UPI0036B1BC84